jgi:SAM-dependent methyltransferase
MRASQDAYGRQLLAQYEGGEPTAEIVERSDGYIDTGADPGAYFEPYHAWSLIERRALRYARGRVLDIGCGAGRHSLYLQEKEVDVTGIDNSPGAIKVCKLRGLKKALVRPISNIDRFKPESFDTVLMLGNNFGLFGSAAGAKRLLKKLSLITAPDARIIAGTRNPYLTTDPDHLQYQRANKKRGRMPGQIRLRVRFGKIIGEWFDYLLVSPKEMESLLNGSDWQIERLIGSGEPTYYAVIGKKEEGNRRSGA